MQKTAHYRNASQVLGQSMSIEQAIGSCNDGYPSAGHPIFSYTPELDCVVASHAVVDGKQQVHLAIFEAGAGAAVVETLTDVRVEEEPAPDEKEFIRSQVFLICSSHDVIFTTHNSPMRDSRVNVLLNSLIETFAGVAETPSYLLQAALDEERYREIMDQGIGEIDLGIGGFRQTLEHAISDGQVVQTGLMGVLASLVSQDPTAEERAAAEKISGRFILRPGRDWENAEVKSILTDMAMELLDDGHDDGFTIVTKNGLRISKDSVRLTENFSADGNRQVVNTNQIFSGLHQAFDKFVGMGVLGDDAIVINPNES